jgi:hypothetical protein
MPSSTQLTNEVMGSVVISHTPDHLHAHGVHNPVCYCLSVDGEKRKDGLLQVLRLSASLTTAQIQFLHNGI